MIIFEVFSQDWVPHAQYIGERKYSNRLNTQGLDHVGANRDRILENLYKRSHQVLGIMHSLL